MIANPKDSLKNSRSKLTDKISQWNSEYVFDKAWRMRNKVALFSPDHRKMYLIDILLDCIEDDIYKEIFEKIRKDKEREEEQGVLSLRDSEYVPGLGNYLRDREDSMTEEEKEKMFDRLKF